MVIGRQVISGFKGRLNLSGGLVKASWLSSLSIVVLPFAVPPLEREIKRKKKHIHCLINYLPSASLQSNEL